MLDSRLSNQSCLFNSVGRACAPLAYGRRRNLRKGRSALDDQSQECTSIGCLSEHRCENTARRHLNLRGRSFHPSTAIAHRIHCLVRHVQIVLKLRTLPTSPQMSKVSRMSTVFKVSGVPEVPRCPCSLSRPQGSLLFLPGPRRPRKSRQTVAGDRTRSRTRGWHQRLESLGHAVVTTCLAHTLTLAILRTRTSTTKTKFEPTPLRTVLCNRSNAPFRQAVVLAQCRGALLCDADRNPWRTHVRLRRGPAATPMRVGGWSHSPRSSGPLVLAHLREVLQNPRPFS